jgi:tetratricopeptide (TPR) repeat protein
MTPRESRTRVERLFQDALDLPREARAGYLLDACQGNESLRLTVQGLLNALAQADAGKAFEASALQHVTADTSLDRYRLIERIGAGGMAVVYKAARSDDEFSKLVAVKVVLAPDEQMVSRFRRERQMLAGLEHPNIARLLDGGTASDGSPFLVMEYVDGVPLDRYVAEAQIDVHRILSLFRKICAAVSYAHRNLIVHRDLKPANILVTVEGEPKLLDFGIAKLMDASAVRTRTGFGAMTPEYASPEQLRGAAITTATDVYSLGVILYELLARVRPYGNTTGALALADAIVSRTPDPLRGRAGRSIDPDLDNIVQMALRKEPERRYESAEQFAEDIRRYQEGYPVTARPATRGYVLRKFAARNKVVISAAALVLVTLAAGVAATLREAHIANQRFQDVRRLAHSVLFDYHDSIANMPGAVAVRQRLVRDGLDYLDRLSAQAGGDPGLQMELAGGYLKVGDVQGGVYTPNLGDVRGGLASYGKAIALFEALNRRDPANTEIQEVLGLAERDIGALQQQAGDPKSAAANLRKAIARFERLCATGRYRMQQRLYAADAYEGVDDRRNILSGLYLTMGRVAGDPIVPNLGDPKEAERWYRKDLALLQTMPQDKPHLSAIGIVHAYLATLMAYAGDHQGALAEQRQVLAVKLRSAGIPPVSDFDRRELAIAYHNLGADLLDVRDPDQALENFQTAGRMFEELAARDAKNADARTNLANNTRRIAETLSRLRQYAAAEKTFQQAIAMYQALAAKDPDNAALRVRLGIAYLALGVMHSDTRRGAATVTAATQAAKTFEPLGAANPTARQLLARSYYLCGKGQEMEANWSAAHDWYRRSVELWSDIRSKGQLAGSNAALPGQAEEALRLSEKHPHKN